MPVTGQQNKEYNRNAKKETPVRGSGRETASSAESAVRGMDKGNAPEQII